MCSVPCGKGVQQRFRRCLLDNPMMTLNYNYNVLNGEDMEEYMEEQPDTETETETEMEADFDNNALDMDYELVTEMDAVLINGQDGPHDNEDDISQRIITRPENPKISQSPPPSNVEESQSLHKDNGNNDFNGKDSVMVRNEFLGNNNFPSKKNEILSGKGFHQQVEIKSRTATNDVNVDELMTTEEEKETVMETETERGPIRRRERGRRRERRHHRLTKAYSTLFCEGYNVEQRNCNVFECSGKWLLSSLHQDDKNSF